MKVVRKEFGSDYENYHFGYSIWGMLTPSDSLNEVYEQGFLPYSGQLDSTQTLYMARSIRVPLADFKLSSENRRILKNADWDFVRECVPYGEFDTGDPEFLRFCNRYFLKRHHMDIRRSGKLEAVLGAGFITDIAVYRTPEGKPSGYVFLVRDGVMSHFWFSFYDIELVRKSLGMWLMIREVQVAKESGQKYMYLGTCYGERALYKTNFQPVEWWDGSLWSSDLQILKKLARQEIKQH